MSYIIAGGGAADNNHLLIGYHDSGKKLMYAVDNDQYVTEIPGIYHNIAFYHRQG